MHESQEKNSTLLTPLNPGDIFDDVCVSNHFCHSFALQGPDTGGLVIRSGQDPAKTNHSFTALLKSRDLTASIILPLGVSIDGTNPVIVHHTLLGLRRCDPLHILDLHNFFLQHTHTQLNVKP